MKKAIIFIFSCMLILTSLKAQHVFDKGSLAINAGLGIGGIDGLFPSLDVSGEYGAIPTGKIGVVSFGGRLAYKYSRYNYIYTNYYYGANEKYSYNQFEIGVRAAWHLLYFNSDKWDVYAGVGTGIHLYNDYNYNYTNGRIVGSPRTGIYSEEFVGGRMMMNDGFGFYAEVGYSVTSLARIGLTFLF